MAATSVEITIATPKGETDRFRAQARRLLREAERRRGFRDGTNWCVGIFCRIDTVGRRRVRTRLWARLAKNPREFNKAPGFMGILNASESLERSNA